MTLVMSATPEGELLAHSTLYNGRVWTQWAELLRRAIEALERIATALESADPEWRRQRDIGSDKTEVLTRGDR